MISYGDGFDSTMNIKISQLLRKSKKDELLRMLVLKAFHILLDAYIIINKIHFSYDFPEPQHMLGLKGYGRKEVGCIPYSDKN